jgi:hypothetical protein
MNVLCEALSRTQNILNYPYLLQTIIVFRPIPSRLPLKLLGLHRISSY